MSGPHSRGIYKSEPAMNETTDLQPKTIFRRIEEPPSLFGSPMDPWQVYFILGLLLLIGIVYVIWMYSRDSKSIGMTWACLLGFIRVLVYVLLAAVFLMPARKPVKETISHSKVLVLFDTSLSLRTRDDLP